MADFFIPEISSSDWSGIRSRERVQSWLSKADEALFPGRGQSPKLLKVPIPPPASIVITAVLASNHLDATAGPPPHEVIRDLQDSVGQDESQPHDVERIDVCKGKGDVECIGDDSHADDIVQSSILPPSGLLDDDNQGRQDEGVEGEEWTRGEERPKGADIPEDPGDHDIRVDSKNGCYRGKADPRLAGKGPVCKCHWASGRMVLPVDKKTRLWHIPRQIDFGFWLVAYNCHMGERRLHRMRLRRTKRSSSLSKTLHRHTLYRYESWNISTYNHTPNSLIPISARV